MAERRTNFSRLNMHFGELITAAVSSAQISAIELPKLDDKFFVLKSDDIPGMNALTAFGATMPLLASSKIMFAGQPVLAVFGADYESVTIASRDTKIHFTETDMAKYLLPRFVPEPKTLQWGSINSAVEGKEDLKKIETTYSQKSFKNPNYNYLTCTAWQEGGNIHIEVPCQWPDLLKRTAADAISVPLKNIVIHPLPYDAPNDEYLFTSIVVGALSAVSCVKTNLPVELRTKINSYSSSFSVKRTTWVNPDGKLIAENVEMTADIGAFPFGGEEYQRQALTGLIPNYNIQAFLATVHISPSNTSIRGFFGSLGYAEALSATESHTNHLSTILDINPLSFRLNYFPVERRFTDYIPSFKTAPLTKLCKNIAAESVFLRKWISYNLQKGDFSLLSFSRGIGIAAGVGISGFSTTYAQSTNFQAKLTLTEKNNLTINTSFPARGNKEEIWKGVAASEMELKDTNSVILLDYDSATINSGPDVLNSSHSKFAKQILTGCRKLVQMGQSEPRPYSIMIDVDNKLFPCEFENIGYGALVVELLINNTSFSPIVQEVWGHFRFGNIFNRKTIINQLKEEILRTLDQCGASFKTKDKPLSINITLENDLSENISDMKSTLQGLTRAAYHCALKQALGKNVPPLPIDAVKIERAISIGDMR